MEAAGLAAQAGGDGHQDVLRTHVGLYRRSCVEFYPSCAGLTRASRSWNPCPRRLFLSSGDLMADRRFDFARDLQLKGDLAAAADLLMQAIELAPNFASAWFTLGEIREAARRARGGDRGVSEGAGQPIPTTATAPALRLMRLGAEPAGRHAAGLCADAVRSVCAAVRSRAGRRSRLSRPGAAVQGGAVGARRRRRKPAFFKRAIDLGCGTGLARCRLRQGGRSFHRHRSVAAHDRAGARHRPLRRA